MNCEDQTADEILDIKAACAFLKISKGTLKKLPIPRIKIRRRVLYQKSAILNFLHENTKGRENGT
jgi:hypothetical protein